MHLFERDVVASDGKLVFLDIAEFNLREKGDK